MRIIRNLFIPTTHSIRNFAIINFIQRILPGGWTLPINLLKIQNRGLFLRYLNFIARLLIQILLFGHKKLVLAYLTDFFLYWSHFLLLFDQISVEPSLPVFRGFSDPLIVFRLAIRLIKFSFLFLSDCLGIDYLWASHQIANKLNKNIYDSKL